MSGVVLTAHVKDAAKWEKSFRTHSDIFKQSNISLVHYSISGNDVVLYSETDDVDAYRKLVESPAVTRAMAEDGVDRGSVRVYNLDKEFKPS
jgi:hypothetical protein